MRALQVLTVGVIALAGCARVSTTTTLAADGTFKRVEKITMLAPSGAVSFNKFFHFRAEKDGVTYAKLNSDVESELVVTREGEAGAKDPVDLVVLDDKGKPIVNSTVTVTKRPDGNLLYEERLHWVGEPTPFDSDSYFSKLDQIRAALPPDVRSQKAAVALTTGSSEFMNAALYGPPNPLLVKSLLAPAVTKLQMQDQMEGYLSNHKAEWFPNITDDQIAVLARTLLRIDKDKAFEHVHLDSDAGLGPLTGSNPLTYVVTPPGKVLETNGLTSKEGKVYWAVVPLAAKKHDIVLSLVASTK